MTAARATRIYKTYDKHSYVSDPGVAFVLRAKENASKSSSDLTKSQSLETHKLLQQWDQLEVQDGFLAHKFEQEGKGVIVPQGRRKEILHQQHGGPTSAHLGEAKILVCMSVGLMFVGIYRKFQTNAFKFFPKLVYSVGESYSQSAALAWSFGDLKQRLN